MVTIGGAQRSAAAAKVNERRRDGPWIVAAGRTAGREGSPPAISDDPAPVRVAASVETEVWIDAMLGVLAPTGSWTVTSVYDVREDWGGVIRVATLHGPHAVHRVYFVTSDGEMITLNLVGLLAPDDRSTGPPLSEKQLVTLATSMGEHRPQPVSGGSGGRP